MAAPIFRLSGGFIASSRLCCHRLGHFLEQQARAHPVMHQHKPEQNCADFFQPAHSYSIQVTLIEYSVHQFCDRPPYFEFVLPEKWVTSSVSNLVIILACSLPQAVQPAWQLFKLYSGVAFPTYPLANNGLYSPRDWGIQIRTVYRQSIFIRRLRRLHRFLPVSSAKSA